MTHMTSDEINAAIARGPEKAVEPSVPDLRALPSAIPPLPVYGPGGACPRTLESFGPSDLIGGACEVCRHAKMAHHAFGCGWVGCKGGGE